MSGGNTIGGGGHSVPHQSTGHAGGLNDLSAFVTPELAHLFDPRSAVGLPIQSTMRTDMNHFLHHPTMQPEGDHLDLSHHKAPASTTMGLLAKLGLSAGAVVGIQRFLLPLVPRLAAIHPALATLGGALGITGMGVGIWKGVQALEGLWRKIRGLPEDSHDAHSSHGNGAPNHVAGTGGSVAPDFISNIGGGAGGGGH